MKKYFLFLSILAISTGFSFLISNGCSENPTSGGSHTPTPTQTPLPGPSDERVKTDIVPVTHALDTILKLKPVAYRYNEAFLKNHSDFQDKTYYSFLAQEYRQVFPGDVMGRGEFLDGVQDKEHEILGLNPASANIVAIKAIQEQQALIKAQQKQLNEMKNEIQALKKKLGK
jgi:hypothetical protein